MLAEFGGLKPFGDGGGGGNYMELDLNMSDKIGGNINPTETIV